MPFTQGETLTGWGVVRQSPWHFVALYQTQKEAEEKAMQMGAEYVAVFGENRAGTDDFIRTEEPKFRTPSLADFQRHIDEIIHQSERDARKKIQDVRMSASQHGATGGSRELILIFEGLDQIHSGIIQQTLRLVGRFTKIVPNLRVGTYIPTIRTRLGQFQEGLLAMPNGSTPPQDYTRFFNQYAAIFRQRLDHAIKDIEIGFLDDGEQVIDGTEGKVQSASAMGGDFFFPKTSQ